jgi:hypothetical protein
LATNYGAAPVTAHLTITPYYSNNLVVCVGSSSNFTITVNPQPSVAQPTNQVVCSGSFTTVSFTGLATSYTWVNDVANIGLATNGAGNISFLATNNGATPVTAHLTVTPIYSNNLVICSGASSNFTITVINAVPAPTNPTDQTNCLGVPNPPLTVSVPGGYTVDWYDATNGTLVAFGTSSITPTNRTPGTATYYTQSRDLVTGCVNPNRTPVHLYVQDCSQPLSITLSNGYVVLQWFGNLELQTSLTIDPGSMVWQHVTNGVAGVTNTVIVPATAPQQYFRLSNGVLNGPVLAIRHVKGKTVVEWMGNRILQATPVLTVPVTWTNVATGDLGITNRWTNTLSTPQGFFRLNPPASP